MLDLLLKGGTVYDGTGGPPYIADVGVVNGAIQEIGNLADAASTETLDVSGFAVAPGFIDLHTHSDFTLLVNGRAESQVHQGVTTEIVGQCGYSCAPVTCDNNIESGAIGYVDGCVELGWRTFNDYLERLDATALGVNVGACVGHGSIQRAVLGDALRPPNIEELKEMSSLVDEAFEQGAIGLSTGLEYWPGILSSIEHLVPICEVAGRHGGLYATHVRNRDVYYDLAFSEAIATARAAGAKLQISHIQPKFGAPSYAMEHTLELIESARSHDVDVAFDVIPHDWAHTRVTSILPRWAQEGGVPKLLDRLTNVTDRENMKSNPTPHWRLVTAGRWDDIRILHSEANPDLIGATLSEIGRIRKIDPYDAVLDLLLEEGEGLQHLLWTSHSFSDDDIELCIKQDQCAVISDTLALSPYGPLAKQIGSLSGYGWAARFLEDYVRNRNVISLSEGIRKLTSVPASRLQISDRGLIKCGTYADIVVFDSDQIASKFSVKEPRRYASGIVHVLVNGQPVMKHGTRTDANPGCVIRHRG